MRNFAVGYGQGFSAGCFQGLEDTPAAQVTEQHNLLGSSAVGVSWSRSAEKAAVSVQLDDVECFFKSAGS